jgi:8-oxo-dGTP pyrophosphatase MutT (NUDIX family)
MTRPRLSGEIIGPLGHALAGGLPGAEAQRAMLVTPPPLRDLLRERPPRMGAVLAVLYPDRGELHVALTRRSAHLRYHGGQVSLPGGASEPGDVSPWHTALREASEEIGLDGDGVACLGALSPIEVPASGYIVQPYLAHAALRPEFHLDPNEVEELVELPLGVLLDPDAKRVEQWQLLDRLARVPCYRHGEIVIWGATAMILSELEAVLRQLAL